ncbi:MAG: hypothetical protein K9J17_09375 [Flavobacteriales bacterium]|nr:hypothetical protein [Flavobacteriales bacterium]
MDIQHVIAREERLRQSVCCSKEIASFLAMTALLIVALTSCRTDFTAESNATESLLGVLNNVEQSSNEIDSRLVQQYVKDVSEKCQKIQNELTDTLELDQAQKLVNFCGLQEHLQSCLQRKELIDAQVVQTRNQLFNLKTDLKERRANKDSTNLYIEQEFLFVESLNEGTEQVVAELNACFETYAELKDEIDRLLIALPSKELDEAE